MIGFSVSLHLNRNDLEHVVLQVVHGMRHFLNVCGQHIFASIFRNCFFTDFLVDVECTSVLVQLVHQLIDLITPDMPVVCLTHDRFVLFIRQATDVHQEEGPPKLGVIACQSHQFLVAVRAFLDEISSTEVLESFVLLQRGRGRE